MRRKQNEENKPQAQAPQAWITMMWHMGTRLPWTWRLGPSNSSERDHVKAILREEDSQENTLFCGDAGFTGYPLWSQILSQGFHFLVRIGANVKLLSEHADVKKLRRGIVLCWPKGKMDSGETPLRLRLVQVTIGKTKMWLLTSVLDRRELNNKTMIRFYEMRWGIEVEFRGLKQTIDKHMLRCRKCWVRKGDGVLFRYTISDEGPNIMEKIGKGDGQSPGYSGGIRQLRIYLQSIRAAKGRVYQDIIYRPGEAIQIDWGDVGKIKIQNTVRRISVFVSVLCYSRMCYIEFTLSQRKAEFYRCLANALQFFGGSPRKVVFDNLKAAVISGSGRHATLHPFNGAIVSPRR